MPQNYAKIFHETAGSENLKIAMTKEWTSNIEENG
jgi:hypothetical protein